MSLKNTELFFLTECKQSVCKCKYSKNHKRFFNSSKIIVNFNSKLQNKSNLITKLFEELNDIPKISLYLIFIQKITDIVIHSINYRMYNDINTYFLKQNEEEHFDLVYSKLNFLNTSNINIINVYLNYLYSIINKIKRNNPIEELMNKIDFKFEDITKINYKLSSNKAKKYSIDTCSCKPTKNINKKQLKIRDIKIMMNDY